MSTKSRQTIFGGRIIGAKIRAEGARKRAAEAIRKADRAEKKINALQRVRIQSNHNDKKFIDGDRNVVVNLVAPNEGPTTWTLVPE